MVAMDGPPGAVSFERFESTIPGDVGV